ncbi:MAG: hemolysin D, partial [Planctomycetaceae bacterium]
MQHATAAPSMQPSSQRPIPLRKRDDLIVEEVHYQGVPYPVVKDPCGLKYYRLQPEQYAALRLLDGRRSLDQVRDELQREFPTIPFTLRSVQQLIQDLHQKSLLLSERPGRGIALVHQRTERKWKEFWNVVRNPLYIRLPGWDPERFLQFAYPVVRWVFHPLAVLCIFTLVISSWIFLAMRFGEVRDKLPEFQQFFGWPNLIYLWCTLAFAKIMHEFGHAFSCKHFGGECHGIGVMLLVFSPTLYCDVTDSWMLKNKWQRIFIGAAGMYVEVVLASIAIFLWWHAKPGMVQHLCLNLFFVSTVTTVIFNANPLLRYDGYYMLADFLEIPNLRQKASTMLQHTFAWYCLGIEMPEDPFMPKAGKGWFIFYAIASSLYRWFVLAGITIFLYTVLKPYRLQSIGIMLATVSIGAVFVNLGWSVVKIIRMPRTEPMSAPKIATTLTVAALLLAAAVLIPFPWFTQSPFVIEPVDVHHVYTQTPGILDEVA